MYLLYKKHNILSDMYLHYHQLPSIPRHMVSEVCMTANIAMLFFLNDTLSVLTIQNWYETIFLDFVVDLRFKKTL